MDIRILFYSLFRYPVQKSGRCPFFFLKTLKIEIFSNGNPDRVGVGVGIMWLRVVLGVVMNHEKCQFGVSI